MEEKRSGSIAAKLDNFWYHYKWHTIITLFVVIVITVCAVQCAGNTDYDIQVLYAGNHHFARTASDGGFSDYLETVSSFSDLADDYNEDGEVNVSFLDLYCLKRGDRAEGVVRGEGCRGEVSRKLDGLKICTILEHPFTKFSQTITDSDGPQ